MTAAGATGVGAQRFVQGAMIDSCQANISR